MGWCEKRRVQVLRARRARGAASLQVVFATVLAVVLLVSGIGLRMFSGRDNENVIKKPLVKSFDDFPLTFLDYKWVRGKLDDQTEKVAGADAYLKITGMRPGDPLWVDLYASYVGGGRILLQHEPQVCYGAQGWQLPWGIVPGEVEMPATAERAAWKLPVNIYVFERDFNYILVVNYYCTEWHYTNDRTETRLHPGFFLQTRVTMPLADADVALGKESFQTNPHYQQALEVLRYAVPRLEEYLPPKEAAPAS
jgi:hypothetical protein